MIDSSADITLDSPTMPSLRARDYERIIPPSGGRDTFDRSAHKRRKVFYCAFLAALLSPRRAASSDRVPAVPRALRLIAVRAAAGRNSPFRSCLSPTPSRCGIQNPKPRLLQTLAAVLG